MALTVEGKLLTWRAREEGLAIKAPAGASPLVMDRFRGATTWKRAIRGDPGSLREIGECTSQAVFNRLTGRVETDRPDTPVVWQALVDKPNVIDVACGQAHTLALLETGQVRKTIIMMAPLSLGQSY